MKKTTTQNLDVVIMNLLLIPFIAILATVLIVSNELAYGVSSGKYFWFYGSIGLVGIAAISAFAIRRRQINMTLQDILVLFFALVSLIMFNVESVTTTNKYTFFGLIMLMYFYFRIYFSQYKPAIFYLTVFFILTGTIEAIWGLGQLFSTTNSSFYSITGSFFEPEPYSGYLAITIPAAFHFLIKDSFLLKSKYDRRFMPFYIRWAVSCLTIILALPALYATMSRLSWLACITGCGISIACYFCGKNKSRNYFLLNKKKVCIISGILLSGVIGISGVYLLNKDSDKGRILTWKLSAQMISENPYGVGLGNFSGSYGLKQANYFSEGNSSESEQEAAESPEFVYNDFLYVGVEFGVLPLALFITFTFVSIYSGIINRRTGQVGSLIALLTFASMSYPFNVLPFLITLFFLLAVNTTRCTNKQIISLPSLAAKLTLGTFALVVAGFCLYHKYPSYHAFKQWNKDKIQYDAGEFVNAAAAYAITYPCLSDQVAFLLEYAQSLSKTGQFKESNKVLEQAEKFTCNPALHYEMGKNFLALADYKAAEKCFIMSSHILPNRIDPYYLLANLYLRTGEMEKAKEMAKIALTKELKAESTIIMEMKWQMEEIVNK